MYIVQFNMLIFCVWSLQELRDSLLPFINEVLALFKYIK